MNRLIAFLVLALIACQPPIQEVGSPVLVQASVAVSATFRKQATSQDVDHYVFKLKESGTHQEVAATTTSQTSAGFGQIGNGTYYLQVDAQDATNTSLVSGGPQSSANTVTIRGDQVTYSSGSRLAVSLTLVDTIGANIVASVSTPGSSVLSALFDTANGNVVADFIHPTGSFQYRYVKDGTYRVGAYATLGGGLATPFKWSNSVTVSGAGHSVSGPANISITGNIDTVAGGGVGDGLVATSAYMRPNGAVYDPSGNLYIADFMLQRVRKVAAGSQIITTIAGTGVNGLSGDGGLASAAVLNYPIDVATDSVGNLYIAGISSTIRKISAATGIITRVAGGGAALGDGGPATSGKLVSTRGLAVDGAGNIYIADTSDHRVRKVDAGSGIITTIAGNGTQGFSGDGGLASSAQLSNPWDVTVDASGNVYIGDSGNYRVRRIDAGTGIITTIAGNGSGTASGDGDPATSAGIPNTNSVALDGAGNLYITGGNTHRVRRVDAGTGVITTVAGNGTSSPYAGDGTLATATGMDPENVLVDPAGDLIISSWGRVQKVDLGTGIITTIAGGGVGDGGPASSASLGSSYGAAMDRAGNLFIADTTNHRIRRVGAGTGIITTVAGNGTGTYSGDGGPATSASLGLPHGVAVDGSGNLFIADRSNHRIRKVDAGTGIITTVAGNGTGTYSGDGGPATSASLYYPYGVAVDDSGNLFIADGSNYRIRRVSAGTGIITTVAGNGTGTYAGDGGPATSASLAGPRGVAVDGSGNLYIADNLDHRVRVVDSATGIITTLAGNGAATNGGDGGLATSASLSSPWGIAVDGVGNLYVTAEFRVRMIDRQGVIYSIAGTGVNDFSGDGGVATSAQLQSSRGLSVSVTGEVFVSTGGRVRRIH